MITVEKFYQDNLWVIHALSIENEAVDAWEASVREYIAQMKTPYRALIYDLTPLARPGLTLYMNRRVTALAQDNRTATGRVGIALTLNPTVRYVFEPFIRFTTVQIQPHLNVKLFGDCEQAVDWVAESLPSEIKALGL